jgi:hypothetical protein
LRNAENHSGIAIPENEVDLGIHIVSTMYLYVTYRYITELEIAEVSTSEPTMTYEASPMSSLDIAAEP